MKAPRRVVVTGLGAVTPLGLSIQSTWAQLLAGACGIGRIEKDNVEGFACQIAGEVRGFCADDWVNPREAPFMDDVIPFACAAAKMALQDSEILESGINRGRIGCNLSSAVGGLNVLTRAHEVRLRKGPRFVSPLAVPFTIVDMLCGYISMQHGLRGPSHCIVSACATSADAIGDAFLLIQSGRADAVLTGGAEDLVPTMLASFISARAVTTSSNDNPGAASRPFDKDRDGFVIGEGAAALLLEEREQALARGARVYGEVVGYGAASDAYHMSAPHPEGEGAETAMRNALADAGIAPEAIGYINAHGTSTPLGDPAECKAIRRVFGDKAASVPVSSTKSSTAHMLGAAGAAEAAFCLLALKEGVLPATINYRTPDPECDLDVIPNTPRKADIEYAMSNSFGFGGHCVSLVFRRA